MSYILDALKRADTERERGAVPGLYARQVINPSRTAGGGGSLRFWASLGGTLLVLGLVAAGLYFLRPTAQPIRASSAPLSANQAAPSPILPTPAPAAATEPSPAAFATAIQPVPQARQSHPAPAPIAAPAPMPMPTAAVAAQTSTSAATTPITPITPTSAQPLPSTPLLSELPEELRRQIPALTVTGVVFSDAPGQRLLLVNNLVMTQGSPITSELTLIEVGAKSSIFSFRGNRFRLAH
jgi:general secretion pathway protein B